MNKKKVGELEGTPIVIGKKNYANEHEYYLTMNEDNSYQKLEQRVSGDKFRLVLGGGSNNYPTVTAGDVNKVWQVTPVQKGTKTEETVIVPEQTILYAGNSTFPYDDRFVPGAQCVATIDGVKYSGEVEYDDGFYIFHCTDNFGFEADPNSNLFQFYANDSGEYSIELSVIEETPIYDYNWAPGVSIPIPTAEDEGKILVVTKVEGDNTSTIVPEQEVPADSQTPLTDVDLKYFVPGNTVTATVTITQPDEPDVPDEEEKGGDRALKGPKSSNSQTIVVSGTIEQEDLAFGVRFNKDKEDEFFIAKIPNQSGDEQGDSGGVKNIKSSTDTEYILITNLGQKFTGPDIEPARGNTIPYATIKLEYGEPNYEYQLQENNGGSSDKKSDIGILVLEQADSDTSTISETVTINGQSFSVSNNSRVVYTQGEGVSFKSLASIINIDLFLETSAMDLLRSFDAVTFKINSLSSSSTISISGVLDHNMNYIGLAMSDDVSWVPTVILHIQNTIE